MVYRLGERSHTKRNRLLRQISALLAATILCTTGTAVAFAQTDNTAGQAPSTSKKARNAAKANGVVIRASDQTGTANNAAASPPIIGPGLNMDNTSCALKGDKTMQLDKSTLPQLKKLQEYETVCGGAVTDTMMTFAGMPSSRSEAISLSNWTATNLKEFARYNIRPVVILEPTTSKGLVNFNEYRQGKYDSFMETYFQNLKAKGVTDAMMGIWVPFPEPNIPEWDDTTIEDTAANIAKTVTMQKKYFPTSKASIMLDSMSYPSGSHSWEGGAYTSLVPYVAGIPKGLIDSFGYQGFPWTPPQNEGGLSEANLSASNFLQAGLAIEAAKSLGVSDVWVNTGSFGRSYSGNSSKEVTVSPEIRSQILQSEITEAKKIQNAGLKVSVHLFAENKSGVAEGNDWSYWPAGQGATSPATPIFKAFVAAAKDNSFDFWLFDVSN
jgi:hypothetical protein